MASNLLSYASTEDGTPAEGTALFDTTQGHILEGHGYCHVWNVFLRFEKAKNEDTYTRAQKTIGALAEQIPSVAQLRRDRATGNPRKAAIFVGLSAAGLALLGHTGILRVEDFQEGFRSRVENNVVPVANAWNENWNGRRADALLVCAGNSEEDLKAIDVVTAPGSGVRVLWQEHGQKIPDCKSQPREHFGFVDGVSQPVCPGQSFQRRGWLSAHDPRIALDRVLIEDPLAPGTYGSLLAYLRIQQHVDEFAKAAAALEKQLNPPAGVTAREYAEALLIGRWKNGAALVSRSGDSNDFTRADDPQGTRWPHASHTAKMNPRNGERRPILRRGITYDDGVEKGLLFQSFQSSLSAQFEFLLRDWGMNRCFPECGAGRDPILAPTREEQAFPEKQSAKVTLGGMTTIRGGEYFYFPSKVGVRKIGEALG